MTKYYIRAFYSSWHEVTKEQYENFKKSILDGAINVNKQDEKELNSFLKMKDDFIFRHI